MTKFNSWLVVFALTLGGCVSTSQPISSDSLNHFRDTLADLSVKSNKAMMVEYEWNYRNFKESIKNIKAEEKLDPTPYMLAFCGGTYEWTWGTCEPEAGGSKIPLFNVIENSRVLLSKINQVMVDYANFLIQFNNANQDSKANLEAAAVKIGAATKSISSQFKVELNEAKFGAFATMGVSVVQQLLAKKQRQGMAAVMADFQPGIKSFAGLGSEAMDNSAEGIKKEYGDEIKKYRNAILLEKDGGKRLAQVEQLLKLNGETSAQLDGLKSIGAAYQSLPGAHEELMSALQSGQQASLAELVGHIEMIGGAVQTLKKSDSE